MAITVPVNGTSVGSGTGLTNFAPTLPTGFAAGDFAVFVGVTTSTSGGNVFTQTGGSDTWTGLGTAGALQTDNNTAAAPFESLIAWTVLSAGSTAPTFHFSNSGRMAWAVILLRPTAGSTISLDVAAAVKIDTVSATTHSANSATAAGTNEASLVLAAIIAAATGSTAVTWTAPTSWTSQVTSGQIGTNVTNSVLVGAATNIPVGSGAVTPGTFGSSAASFADGYQLLVKESAPPPAAADASTVYHPPLFAPVRGPGMPGGMPFQPWPPWQRDSAATTQQLTATLTGAVNATGRMPVSLGKAVISDPLSVFSSAQKAFGKIISSPLSVFPSVRNSITKTLAAFAVAFSVVNVKIGRFIAAQAVAFTSVSMQKVKLLTLAGQVAVNSAVTRQLGKTLSGITTITGSVIRQLLRALAAQAVAFSSASLTKVKLLALTAQVVALGAGKVSLGKILSGVTVAYSSLQRVTGKKIAGVATVTGSTARGISRSLSGVAAVPSALAITKVKLLTLAAQVAAYGTQKVSLGKLVQGNAVTYAATRVSLSKNIAAAVAATGNTARSISRALAGVVGVFSSVLANTGTRSVILAAQIVAYGTGKISLGKKIQGILVLSGTVQDVIRKNMTATAVAAGTAVRSLGKNISGVTVAFSGISSVKVKLLTLVAQVAAYAGTARKISPVISAQATVSGGKTVLISRKIAAQAVLAGQAARTLGKNLSGAAAAFSQVATQKVKLLTLSAIAAVTNAVTRRVGSIQPGTVTVNPSVTRKITRKITSIAVVNSTVIAGRAFLVQLAAIMTTSASVAARLSQTAFVIVFKLGTPAFQWITGGLKKIWRIP